MAYAPTPTGQNFADGPPVKDCYNSPFQGNAYNAPGSNLLQRATKYPSTPSDAGNIWAQSNMPSNTPDGFCNYGNYSGKTMAPGHWICEDRDIYPWQNVPYRPDLYYLKCQDCENKLWELGWSQGDYQKMCQGWPSTCTSNNNWPNNCTRWFTVPPDPNPSGDEADASWMYIVGILLAGGAIYFLFLR